MDPVVILCTADRAFWPVIECMVGHKTPYVKVYEAYLRYTCPGCGEVETIGIFLFLTQEGVPTLYQHKRKTKHSPELVRCLPHPDSTFRLPTQTDEIGIELDIEEVPLQRTTTGRVPWNPDQYEN